MKFKIFVISISLLFLSAGRSYCLTLESLLLNSPDIQHHQGFKINQSFHCTEDQSYVNIDGTNYEISTFRVLGLEGNTDYKDFSDLVRKLNLEKEISKTQVLYKDFPSLKFEMMNIKRASPKPIQILIALRVIGPS